MPMIKTGDTQQVKGSVRTVQSCNLIECAKCGRSIPDIKPICPKCGHKQ